MDSPRWIPGFVTIKYGPQNYQVHVSGQHHKWHVDQLQPRYVEIVKDTADTYPRPAKWPGARRQSVPPALPRWYPIRVEPKTSRQTEVLVLRTWKGGNCHSMNIIKYFIVFLFGPEPLLAIQISTSYTVYTVKFRCGSRYMCALRAM